MNTAQVPAVEVVGLTKYYGTVGALRGVDLKIAAGEYFVLLGPSGGGKTTLLRTIGGFNRPTEGRVLLHGNDVSDLPPDKRPTSMVFQSYALFPHMSVAGNVGYGLKLQKLPKAEIEEKVEAMLDMVGLQGYGARKPHELSGGQQQRVQLARSLALDRDILLLDEPLAALDAKLRKDMCLELKHLQEKVGITFIHVTHNQEEAMTVADRIALIADGLLVENGTPDEIYEAPRKRFTADFVGENNILDGTVKDFDGDSATLEIGPNTVVVPIRGSKVRAGQSVSFSIRSELLQLVAPDSKASNGYEVLPVTYREKVYLGLTTSHIVSYSSGPEINVRAMSGSEYVGLSEGQDVRVSWQRNAARLHID